MCECHVSYLRKALQGAKGLGVQLGGEALELARLEDVLGINRLEAVDGALESAVGGAILELDDVLVGDELGAAGLDHGCC